MFTSEDLNPFPQDYLIIVAIHKRLALGTVLQVRLQIVRRNEGCREVPHQPLANHLRAGRPRVPIEYAQQQPGRVHAAALGARVLDRRVGRQLVRVVALHRPAAKLLGVLVPAKNAIYLKD